MFLNLPEKRYNTIVIDPPWPVPLSGQFKSHKNAATLPYATMPLSEIATFPLSALVNTGSHVYLWTTNRFLPDAFDILKAWGVRYHLTMPLVKSSGMAPCGGYVFAAEYCLLGFAGKPMQKFLQCGKLNWLEKNVNVRGEHSRKPEAFYELLEVVSPGPYLDCFARRERPRWDVWGNEVNNSNKIAPTCCAAIPNTARCS